MKAGAERYGSSEQTFGRLGFHRIPPRGQTRMRDQKSTRLGFTVEPEGLTWEGAEQPPREAS